jgi:hypothetical protein
MSQIRQKYVRLGGAPPETKTATAKGGRSCLH